ncbi:MAG: ABC transporter ATP-binding protein [Halobacteriaceae archaeon]
MAAIEVRGLTKAYGDLVANDDLTFEVERGEIFGYLGPNGAGKTTTIRTLMGFLAPTAGEARLLGHDVADEAELVAAKRRVGYLPSDVAFEETTTGREILDLHGAIKGDTRRGELLELFEPPLDRPVREYSSGNRQKLGLVQAFMHDPELVVLDEPTSGLDPLLQQRFNEFVRAERDAGTTVFFSSHVLSEVRRVCDRVGVIRDGELITVETVEDLLARSGKVVTARVGSAVDASELPDGVHDLTTTVLDGAAADVEVSFTYTGDVDALVHALSDHPLRDLTVAEAPIEDVFLRFYGESDGTSPTAGGDRDA